LSTIKGALPKFDGFVKSPFGLIFVIPAKAGIQLIQLVLDSCLRRSDGFPTFYEIIKFWSVILIFDIFFWVLLGGSDAVSLE